MAGVQAEPQADEDSRISRMFRGPEATSHSPGHRARGTGHTLFR